MTRPETTARSGRRSAEGAKEQPRAVAAAESAVPARVEKAAAVVVVGSSAVGVVGLEVDSQ